MKIWLELRRRNVPRMAALYVVTAWLVMQVAEVMIGLGWLPEANGPLLFKILAVGLPIALVLAWFFEGTRADATVDDAARQARARRTDFAIIAVLAAALALAAYIEITTPTLEQSIAVLPFEDLTGDVEHSYLADGMAEEIRHRLTTFGNLTVIDRYSVNKVTGLALAAIAAKLNVEHVLQGSVRRSGERVRIAVSLVNAATEETAWSDSYDRDLTVAGLFDVQVDIARAIAETLQAIITPEAEAQMADAPTQDLEAYRLYLLGKQRLDGNTVTEQGEARGFFERAIAIDPEFAEAYAYLALASTCYPDCMQPAIDKALALDDTLGLAYALRPHLQLYLGTHDPAAARQDFERALALSPGDADVWATYGTYLARGALLDFEGALEVFDRAIALQPLLIETYSEASRAALFLDRPADARAYFERAIAIAPEYADAHQRYAMGLAFFGHGGKYYAEAIATLYKAWELDPKNERTLFMLSGLCLDLGELDGAEALFIASGSLRLGYRVPILATVYHLRGEHERELTWLESFDVASNASRWLVGHYIGDGRYDEALALLRAYSPKLVESREIVAGWNAQMKQNTQDSLLLAQILEGQGKAEEAATLWEQLDPLLDQLLPWKSAWLWPGPALIQAARGRKERALELLRDAVDSGPPYQWRIYLSYPAFDSVRDDPRFQKIVDEIEADMAGQLEQVHAQGLACEVPPTYSADEKQ